MFIIFLLQSLKIFTFRVKSSDSMFFLLGLSHIVYIIFSVHIFFIQLELVKRLEKWIYYVEILYV